VPKYVAIYARISKDKRGRREGVEIQERWGRDYATDAWPDLPVRVFSDNDISAANGAHRPGYAELREAIAAGTVAHLWAVEQSRLERREVEWFQFAALLDAAGITELHTNRDGVVRIRDEIAGIKAVLNAGEVRKLKVRINDRLDALAAEGRPAGSVLFGYRHGIDASGGKTLIQKPAEAEAIRWAAEKVLTGWSLERIAAELRGRGLRGAHGGRLDVRSVRSMVTKGTVAGRRIHRGRDVGPGCWEPILDQDTWQACRRKLGANRTVQRADGRAYPVSAEHQRPGRKYLLTGGLTVCAVCLAPMVGSLKQLANRQRKSYLLCHPNRGGKGCTGILLAETETHVADALFAELDKPEFLAAVAADDHAERRKEIDAALGAIDDQRDDLAEEWGARRLTMSEWQTARRVLAENEQRLRADLADVPPPLIHVDIDTARQAWPEMTLDERREFLRLFISRITVARAIPGTRVYDSGRITITWRRTLSAGL
jgi:DNA invertase Pin-like site-specific DNA recombinase